MQVKEILRGKGSRLLSIELSGRAVDAVVTMAKENVGSLVVMEQGRMVGLLTFHEILRALAGRGGVVGFVHFRGVRAGAGGGGGVAGGSAGRRSHAARSGHHGARNGCQRL